MEMQHKRDCFQMEKEQVISKKKILEKNLEINKQKLIISKIIQY